MNIKCLWQEKLHFSAEADQHRVEMDAKPPMGANAGLSPKQLLLASICGCTGMDIAAFLRKHKQGFMTLEIDAEATATEGKHPIVFQSVSLTFRITGEVDPAKALEAVRLSQTQYCGVSAMVSKAVPISYRVELNGSIIGNGSASFA